MKIKIKKNNKIIRNYKFFKVGDEYLLTDGTYTFKSPNIDFIKSFAERVRSSGHNVYIEDSALYDLTCGQAYGDSCAGCDTCVCNAGDHCLLQKEGD